MTSRGGKAVRLPAGAAADPGALPPRRRRRGLAARPAATAPPWAAALAVSFRVALAAACLGTLWWLLRRGPLVAPISLFSAAGATNGFYSASHILPVMALCGAMAGLGWALSRRIPVPAAGPAAAVLLPLLARVLSTLHAVYPHDARSDLAIAGALAAFYLAATAAVGNGGVYPGLAALAATAVALAGVGLAQFTAGQPTPVAWTGPAFAAVIPVRISATLHNPNALAAALLLGIGAAGALAVGDWPWPLRLPGLLALLPLGAALPLTFSRGAYVGLALTVGLAALGLPREARRRALAALLCLLLPAAGVAARVPGVLYRVHGIGVQTGGDIASRLFTWKDALAVWRTHPAWGVGPGGLQVLFAAHQPRGDLGGTYVLIDVPGSADHDALQWLAENGWVGGLLLAAGLGVALASVLRGLRRAGPGRAAAGAVLLAALGGLALQGMFEVTAYLLPIGAMLAGTGAVLTGLAGLAHPPRSVALGRLAGVGVAAGGLAVAHLLWGTWPAEEAFARGWAQVVAGRPEAALADLRTAAAADPSSERNAAALGDAAVQVAYALPPDRRAGPVAEAQAALSAALALDPFDGDSWAAAAALLRLQGRPEAAACAEQAALQDFPYSPWFAAQLASDLDALGQPEAAAHDLAYAAALFPRQLQVYREYHDEDRPYYHEAETLMAQGRRAWPGASLPARPLLPLPESTCTAALGAAGLPPAAYSRAMRGA